MYYCAADLQGVERADHDDVFVDNTGYCVPYPCPLAFKLYSPDMVNSAYNGYYILNFPAVYNSNCLKK